MYDTSAYMTAPRLYGGTEVSVLPTQAVPPVLSTLKPYDSYPAPSPLRRSYTAVSWKPNASYTRLFGSAPQRQNGMTGLDDTIGLPKVVSASRVEYYSRNSPNDWSSMNQANYSASDRIRADCELIRTNAQQMCKEAEEKLKRGQNESGKYLGERIDDVEFWKREVQNEIECNINEAAALAACTTCLEKALAETETPLKISRECLFHREKRREADMVHDEVEKELQQEVKNIIHCQEEMKKLLELAKRQAQSLRAALHELEKDCSDKFVALQLDGKSHKLKNTSRDIYRYEGIETVDKTISVPQSWIKFSNDNIARSRAERAASKDIRLQIHQLLARCASEMTNKWNYINTLLADRVRDYMEAKHKIQNQLAKVLQEISDMNRGMDLLKKCIVDKEAYLKVAETRLSVREPRPNIESCKDQPQNMIIKEVYDIKQTINSLQSKFGEIEGAMQQLLRTRQSLENDLFMKNSSIFIDRDLCLGLRKSYSMTPRIGCCC